MTKYKSQQDLNIYKKKYAIGLTILFNLIHNVNQKNKSDFMFKFKQFKINQKSKYQIMVKNLNNFYKKKNKDDKKFLFNLMKQ